MNLYKREIYIRFREADPAGILFCGNITNLLHDSFEDFIAFIGVPWNEYFSCQDYHFPVHHLDVKFLNPFFPGEKYNVEISVREIREHSFQLGYRFLSLNNQIHAEAASVHVSLKSSLKLKNTEKTPIPSFLRNPLQKYFEATRSSAIIS